MHAKLASLGFNDPDKGEQLHDLAGQYLALKPNAVRLIDLVHPSGQQPGVPAHETLGRQARHEVPVMRRFSAGFVVGFVDLVLDPLWRYPGESDGRVYHGRGASVLVEVKIGRVAVGDLLRQIALYREHHEGGGWVVAAPWGWTASEKAVLSREGVLAIRLGEAFTAWAQEQKAAVRDQHDGEF